MKGILYVAEANLPNNIFTSQHCKEILASNVFIALNGKSLQLIFYTQAFVRFTVSANYTVLMILCQK